MAYVGFGIEGFSNDLKKFLYVERMFVTIKMVFHFQKNEGKIVEILIFFSIARKIPLIVLYFLSRNTFSIKLVCHTENRFILERLVKNKFLSHKESLCQTYEVSLL